MSSKLLRNILLVFNECIFLAFHCSAIKFMLKRPPPHVLFLLWQLRAYSDCNAAAGKLMD